MNNEPTARKMDTHLEDALEKGAEIVVGGSRDSDRPTGLYYQPTVIDNVGVDTLINRDETFGPIVPADHRGLRRRGARGRERLLPRAAGSRLHAGP